MTPFGIPMLVTLIAVLHSCHGYQEPTSQLVTLETFPPGLRGHQPVKLVIRSIFKTSIEFIPSVQFRVLMNVSSPTGGNLTKFHYNFEEYKGTALLELFSKEKAKYGSPIFFIVLSIGAAAGLAFIISIFFVCWWNKEKRPHLKEHKFEYRDSSQAPLLASRTHRQDRKRHVILRLVTKIVKSSNN